MALSAEHLADLKKSGLSDETIQKAALYSVRPSELKRFPTVQSGLAFPYPGRDGQVNGFARIKLFPPATAADGHTLRYYQPPGTDPALYFPPTVEWSGACADTSHPIAGTEGEKKALALCQLGVPTVGLGGLWSFLTKVDGMRMVLPTLDRIAWPQRPFTFVPDSDVWTREDLLRPVALFCLLLTQRGAKVEIVRLPDHHGTKQGIDDYLAQAAAWPMQAWESLERLSLDDAPLKRAVAWAQRWLEKQVTVAAVRQEQDDLDIEEVAGLYTVRSTAHATAITYDRLTDQRGSIYAEVTVAVGATILLDAADLNLKSDTAQARLAGSLGAYTKAIPWKVVLQKACALVLRRYRHAAPPILLTKDTAVEPLTFAVNPLVPRRKASILYADGGRGKSTLALLQCMLVSVGGAAAGFSALLGRALYLDWEDDQDVHARRLQALQAGHIELHGAEVQYQRCVEPLTKLTYHLARTIQRDRITFVVIDSLLAAMGGDSSAEASGKFFAAVRLLQVESLIIGHTPKTLAEGQEHATVYGSVFSQNYARAVWELKTEQDMGDETAILGLFHRKANLARKHAPIGLKVTQRPDGTLIRYESFDLAQAGELEQALPLASRIRNVLDRDGVPQTAKEIADALNESLKKVQYTLSRYKGHKWHLIGENRDAKWTTLTAK